MRRGDDDHAAHPLGRKGKIDIPLERLTDDVLDHRPAETRTLRRAHFGPSPLLPDELQLGGLLAELPFDTDVAARLRQRSVFRRVGGELMQREPEILHGLGLQHHVLAFDGDLLAEAIGMLAQLLLDQHTQRRAMPIVGDQEVVRAADGHEARAEAIEEILDRTRAGRSLPGDRVDHGEQILGAVGQLAQQETKLILIGLALADVDGDRGRAEDLALLVGQRLDQQIEGALAPEQFEIRLQLLLTLPTALRCVSPP